MTADRRTGGQAVGYGAALLTDGPPDRRTADNQQQNGL